MLIYKITNIINGKVYIGQTTKTLADRIKTHKNSMVSGKQTHLYSAMRKYGWDNFKFEVIATAETQCELNALEEYYIKKYDSVRSGYNMAYGGSINVMYSEIVADKHHKRMRDEKVRRKIYESMKESYVARGGATDEHRKHLSENKKAFYQTERGKEVAREFSQRFNMSDEHKELLRRSHMKSVYCVNEQNEVIAEFDSVIAAAEWWHQNGMQSSKAKNLCNTIKHSFVDDRFVKGIKWVYRV